MLNRTIKFAVSCVIIFFNACSGGEKLPTALEIQHYQDSVSEARIDSAYAKIKGNCDTMLVYQVPKMVDSLLKDSTLVFAFFDTTLFNDTDEKVEKVVRELIADCDTNLLKETYKRARLRQKLKPLRRKK